MDDWRLSPDASIIDDFGHMHDVSHNGRIGNTVTVNGKILDEFSVRSGERVRLRLSRISAGFQPGVKIVSMA